MRASKAEIEAAIQQSEEGWKRLRSSLAGADKESLLRTFMELSLSMGQHFASSRIVNPGIEAQLYAQTFTVISLELSRLEGVIDEAAYKEVSGQMDQLNLAMSVYMREKAGLSRGQN